MNKDFYRSFTGKLWKDEINVRDFIQNNYTPYEGDASLLAGPTEATDKLWGALQELQKQERAKGGVLDMETEVVSGITAYKAAYISNELKAALSRETVFLFPRRQARSCSFRKEREDPRRIRFLKSGE